MTPPVAPSPYSTAPLPRSTSIRSTDSIGMPARRVPLRSASDMRMPSTITTWLLSAVEPKPRRSRLYSPPPKKSWRPTTPRTRIRASLTVVAPERAISSAVITLTPNGNDCEFSGKRVAVTTLGGRVTVACARACAQASRGKAAAARAAALRGRMVLMLTLTVKCPHRLPRRRMGDTATRQAASPPRWPVSGLAGALRRLPRRAVASAPSGCPWTKRDSRAFLRNPTAYRCGGSAGWLGEGFTSRPASR